MRRGTTPTNVFMTDIDLSDAEVIYLTYRSGEENIIEKQKDDMVISPESISVTLTQEDTLALPDEQYVYIQIRARFSDGSAIASNVIKTRVEIILKDGEI